MENLQTPSSDDEESKPLLLDDKPKSKKPRTTHQQNATMIARERANEVRRSRYREKQTMLAAEAAEIVLQKLLQHQEVQTKPTPQSNTYQRPRFNSLFD
jgi:hypothetical protein